MVHFTMMKRANRRMSVLFFCHYIILSYTSEAVPSSQFSKRLDASGLHTLYWTVDYDSQRISMELHSKLPGGSWIALGFSDRGDVSNADFCVAWTDSLNMSRFQDIWSDGSGIIHTDGQQDCTYQGYRKDDVTVSVFSREFDTCDKHDKIIEEGTMRIVWATGPGPVASPEGLDTSTAQHGTASTRLLRPPDPPLTPDVWTLDVFNHNFEVPATEVKWCRIVRLPESFNQKHHLVKYDIVLTPGNKRLIHHVLLRECQVPFSLAQGSCQLGFRKACPKLLAMGMKNFSFPEETGFVLGGPESSMYLMLEIHYTPYDNEERMDHSGFRLYVTPRLRRYDSDIVELGSVHEEEVALPPGQLRFPVISHCTPSCTAISLPSDGITIFAANLHTHVTGVGLVTRHVRGGVELPEVVRDNHFDFHNQGNWLLRRKVNILPGDELITTCYYDTTNLSNITTMGALTSDEMCLIFVLYYPTISLWNCKSSIHDHSLNEYFRRTNGQMKHGEGQLSKRKHNFGMIKWTPERVEDLVDHYKRSPVDAHCFWKDVADGSLPGNWTNLTLVPVQHPLPPSARLCED